MADSHPVLLFDGACGLCNRAVRLLLRADRQGVLRFARLEGPAGQAFLRARGLPMDGFDTLIFVPDWEARTAAPLEVRSRGIAAALGACGGLAAGAGRILRLIPAPVADAAYRLVARTRHRIFGAWQPRPLPRPAWAGRFID